MSIDDYAMVHKSEGKYGSDRIALLIAEGDIIDGEQNNEHEIASKTFCEEIRKVRNDERVKAVVLRVNSPGGSALASEVILRELTLLKQKKPLIVSMGDYAASGGYFISSMADSIFALPNTITGSIGVFSMMFNITQMMRNKLGITFDEVKNAPYADMPSAFRPMTAEEGKRMQNSVDTIYGIFKRHVATGRKLSMSKVDEIAQGRVWTGTDALKIGLIDGLGGMGRALKSAASLAKLKDYKVVTYPEPADKFSIMLHKIKSNSASAEIMKSAIKEETGEEFEWLEKIKSLKNKNNKAMMEMPFVMNVN
jgi:protease-4